MKIAVFDLDGTLADISHRTHYILGPEKDWGAFFGLVSKDKPIEASCTILRTLAMSGFTIWIMSGRSDATRDQTVAWLRKHGVVFDELLMRSEGDRTPDHELKRSWVNSPLVPREHIKMVFEDRSRVVQMWREEGFQTYQVSDGKF